VQKARPKSVLQISIRAQEVPGKLGKSGKSRERLGKVRKSRKKRGKACPAQEKCSNTLLYSGTPEEKLYENSENSSPPQKRRLPKQAEAGGDIQASNSRNGSAAVMVALETGSSRKQAEAEIILSHDYGDVLLYQQTLL